MKIFKITSEEINSDEEILTLDEIKNFLRVSSSHENDIILSQFNAAIEYAEQFTGYYIKKRTFKAEIEIDNKISTSDSNDNLLAKIPTSQLLRLNHVYLMPHEKTLSETQDYTLDSNILEFRNKNILLANTEQIEEEIESAPAHSQIYSDNKITIEYSAGFKSIPSMILQGILRHTAILYDREVIKGDNLDSIHILYSGYRKIRL